MDSKVVQSSDWVRIYPRFQVESLHEVIWLSPILVYSTGLRASFRSIQFSQWVSRWPEGSDQTTLRLLDSHGVHNSVPPRMAEGREGFDVVRKGLKLIKESAF